MGWLSPARMWGMTRHATQQPIGFCSERGSGSFRGPAALGQHRDESFFRLDVLGRLVGVDGTPVGEAHPGCLDIRAAGPFEIRVRCWNRWQTPCGICWDHKFLHAVFLVCCLSGRDVSTAYELRARGLKAVLSSAPMTVEQIIRSLGGPAVVGRYLGIRGQAVSHWIRLGRVPVDRVPGVLRLAKKQRTQLRAEQVRPDIDWAALK